jgi:minor extracellular serine protease Vpr
MNRHVKFVKALLICGAMPFLAGAANHRYIVELSAEPAARFAARNFGERRTSLARPEVEKQRQTIRSQQDTVAAEIRKLGGRIVERTDTAMNTLIVDLPEENAGKLSSIGGVKTLYKNRKHRAMMDQALIVHNIPQAFSMIGGAANAGKGIKIAVIDSGVDISQPAFSDAGFQAPDGYPKVNATADTQYTNNKVIVARSYVSLLDDPTDPDQTASDEIGHGTITASCAAGAATMADIGKYLGQSDLTAVTFTGVAPGAYVGSYKVFGTPGVNDSANDPAILKAIDDAVKDGMDVINYSLGQDVPSLYKDDPVAQALNGAVAAGLIVAASAGNDGNGYDGGSPLFYYSSADGHAFTIPQTVSPDGAQNVITVGASANRRAFGPGLTVGGSQYLVDPEDSFTTDAQNNTLLFQDAPVVDVATLDQTGQACSALPAGSLKGAIALISLDGWDAADDTCNANDKFDNAMNAGAVAAVIYDLYPEDLRNFYDYSYLFGYDWLGLTNLPGGFITYADGIALKAQLAATGGTATGTFDLNYRTVTTPSNVAAFLSARGPSVEYEIKPDIMAVGENLLTIAETLNKGADFYDPSGLLYPIDGTSISAPLVSGAAALLKAARPGLTTLQYRSLLVNSAAPMIDSAYGGPARVMDVGAGLLDVNASLNAEAAAVPASLSFGIGDGTALTGKTMTVTNTGSATDTFAITVAARDSGFAPQVSPASVTLDPGASTTIQVSVPAAPLKAGQYEGSIQIQGNNTAVVSHVPYWFGVPSATPYFIVDMGSDAQDTAGRVAQYAVVFRITDASGIRLADPLANLQVTYTGVDARGNGNITAGSGKVSDPYLLDSYSPGTVAVDVTLDTHRNYYNVIHAQAGDVGLDFYIQGK